MVLLLCAGAPGDDKPPPDKNAEAVGKTFASLRGYLFGRPLASEDELGERLSKTKALAIFSSDAISSSAYATEEILRVLILGGAAALVLGVWVSAAISILLVAVVALVLVRSRRSQVAPEASAETAATPPAPAPPAATGDPAQPPPPAG
jgi:hypothetical protein